MSSRLVRVSRILFHSIPLGLAAAFLIVAVGLNFANVVGRYVFLTAIYWAEEAMIYLSIWSIFLAAIAIAYDRADLTMDFFSARLAEKWKRFADAIMTAVTVTVCLFMAWQSLAIARVLVRNGQKSLALEIPMVVPQASLLFGFIMIATAVAARFLLKPASGEPDARLQRDPVEPAI